MRVLHLLTSSVFSGAENVVCQIINMTKDEKDVEMIYCSLDGAIRDALNERSIAFCPIDKLSVAEVKRVINEVKPDVVHAHDMRASFVAALSCGKIPLVSHIHNNAFDSRGLSMKSIAYLYAAIKAKHIFWVSKSSFEGYVFHSAFSKKSSILYNIIDIDDLYKRMNQDTNTYDYDVVYVGRLTYPKNPERLVDVLTKVIDKKPDTKVAIVGTGDIESTVKQIISQRGLKNNIDMLGYQSNPLKIMHDAKVMIMTSRWEGTPMCALEAMALGLPIVSTPTDGLCELVREEVTGNLSSDDNVLAEKCLNLITDDTLRQAFSKQIVEDAHRMMDIEQYKKSVLNTYR